MSGYTDELFASYSAVEARREWEIEFIKEKLEKNEPVDLPVCRVERVSSTRRTVRFGLKRGKLLYLFKYPTHDVEREKHRNVITRARFIKHALEQAGYRLIPWDFKKGKPPNFWEEGAGLGAMEEDDDDLYGHGETAEKGPVKQESASADEDEPMLESGEEEDADEDSESDLEVIIDKPAVVPKAAPEPKESKAIKIEAPPKQTSAPSHQAPISIAPSVPTQPGTAYPAIKSSNIDVNADPVYPHVGKPISQVDMDADMAEATKPWRLPGADQSDYFNYGFDEFTWEMYRQRQTNMQNTLASQKAEVQQFQQMFGVPGNPAPNTSGAGAGAGAGAGGVPGAPTGPGGGGGMGGGIAMPPGGMNEEHMQMMMAQMAQSGIDPSQMDFGTFMAMAGGFGAGGGGGGPGFGGGGGPAGNQGGGGRGSSRRGRGGW